MFIDLFSCDFRFGIIIVGNPKVLSKVSNLFNIYSWYIYKESVIFILEINLKMDNQSMWP